MPPADPRQSISEVISRMRWMIRSIDRIAQTVEKAREDIETIRDELNSEINALMQQSPQTRRHDE